MQLNKEQVITLYALLCQQEKLNLPLVAVHNQLSNLAFPLLTIEESANLKNLLKDN
ncbi:MAG: hypothetical protein FWE37_00090 [Spirochaetaceae bacterium]|nr:hypothetical protein [Spirochaetaceae bacterium]